MRLLFGSSQIEFYETLLRAVLGVIWEQLKVKEHFRVLMNVSLPITSPQFREEDYYGCLLEEVKKGLLAVL